MPSTALAHCWTSYSQRRPMDANKDWIRCPLAYPPDPVPAHCSWTVSRGAGFFFFALALSLSLSPSLVLSGTVHARRCASGAVCGMAGVGKFVCLLARSGEGYTSVCRSADPRGGLRWAHRALARLYRRAAGWVGSCVCAWLRTGTAGMVHRPAPASLVLPSPARGDGAVSDPSCVRLLRVVWTRGDRRLGRLRRGDACVP